MLVGGTLHPSPCQGSPLGRPIAKHYEGIVFHDPLHARGVENISGDQHRTTAPQDSSRRRKFSPGGLNG
jgi:hypothetical protein